MDDAEYQRLVRLAFAEKARAVAQAEARFRDRIEAINRTRELSAIDEARNGNGGVTLPYGEVSTRVKELLADMPETFTLADMTKAIRQKDAFGEAVDNKAISVALRRMIGEQLELLEKGQGKRGSKYRKLKIDGSMTLVG